MSLSQIWASSCWINFAFAYTVTVTVPQTESVSLRATCLRLVVKSLCCHFATVTVTVAPLPRCGGLLRRYRLAQQLLLLLLRPHAAAQWHLPVGVARVLPPSRALRGARAARSAGPLWFKFR